MVALVTIHGFLGSPQDWSFLPANVCLNIDLFDQTIFAPQEGLWQAGSKVNSIAEKLPSKKVLVAYSLGGRIALHALLENPALWHGAVIISTNPGLSSSQEREARIHHDKVWALRFKEESWETVIADWNSQKVFSGKDMVRNPIKISRDMLAASLEGWSLGRQEDLSCSLQKLFLPILWITGEEDYKFTSIAKDVKLAHPLSRHCVIRGAAHRVPWEQKEGFLRETQYFIKSVTKPRGDTYDCDHNADLAGNQKI